MGELLADVMSEVESIVGGLLIGFAFGSVPFGYLLVRLTLGTDVRQTGSGNIGATNVARALGTKGGAVTLVLDAAKGAAGVFAAGYIGLVVLGGDHTAWAASAALGAVLGHCYTPWLALRGGKGVATLIGAFGVLAPAPTAVGAGLLLLAAAMSRMVSLASLFGTLALPVAAWWLGEVRYTVAAATLAAGVIVWRHRANIVRIAQGREAKIGGARA